MNFKKTVVIFLAFLLVVQNLLFAGITQADEQNGSGNSSSVTDSVYGTSPFSVTNAVYLMNAEDWVELTHVRMFVMDDNGEPVDVEDFDERLAMGDRVELAYAWELPAGHPLQEGDTFSFTIPTDFFTIFNTVGPLELTGGSGEFTVDTLGQVTMTFSHLIEGGLGVSDGELRFWSEIRTDLTGESTDREVAFPVVDQSIFVNLEPKDGAAIEKNIDTSAIGYNEQTLEWWLDFNTSLAAIEAARIVDDMPTGIQLDTTSIEVYELDVDVSGTVTEGSPVHPAEYSTTASTADKLELSFNDPIDVAYRVKFTTDVLDGDGNLSVNNTATLYDDHSPLGSDNASATVERGAMLEKSTVNNSYNSVDHSVEWEILYNFGERPIAENDAVLIDTFGGIAQEIVGGLNESSFTVEKLTLNEGTITGTTPYTSFAVVPHPDPSTSGFQLSFAEDIDSAFRIRYRTQAANPVYGSGTMTNTVEFDERSAGPVNQSIGQVIINKPSPDVDYAAKSADWVIRINHNEFTMDNVVVEDEFPNGGLELDIGSIEIQNNSTNATLMEGTHYEVDATEDGFRIEFLASISAPHTITYTTAFNYDELNGSTFRNSASIDWDGAEEPSNPVTSSNSFSPGSYTVNNGIKTGEYDATNKRITWKIGFNYNLRSLTDAYVLDLLEKEQQLVENSIAVYPWNLGKGQNSASPDTTHPLTKGTDYEVKVAPGPNSGETELTITLTGSHANTNAAYYIEFETSLEEQIIEASYENEAELYSNDALEDSDLRHTVHIPHGGKYVSKTGKQNGLLIDWEIRINEGQSSLDAGMKIIDTPSPNQILLEDTFVIYTTNVSTGGTITKAAGPDNTLEIGVDYALEFTENNDGDPIFIIEFTNPQTRPYILEYQSFINAEHNDTVSNAVEFVGYGSASDVTDSNHPVTIDLSGGSGGGTIQKGSIQVLKVDAENHSKVLEGATFSLYFDNANRTFVRELQTDANGIALFENLMLNMPYILVESAAPTNYVRDEQSERQIVLDPAEQDVTIQFENISLQSETLLGELGDYVWLDTSRDGIQNEPSENGVNGVNVLLYEKEASGDYKWLATKVTDDEGGDPNRPGFYLFNQLLPSTYKVCFEKPEGYAFTEAGQGDFEGAATTDSDAGLGTLPHAFPAGIDEERIACSDDIELDLGEKVHTIDAGLLLGKIGDYVWYDVNRNGIQDTSETGINDVNVLLYRKNASGQYVFAADTVTADKNHDPKQPGYYLFDNLAVGEYQVCFERPEAYGFTAPGQGEEANAAAADSDAGLGTSPHAFPAGIAEERVQCSDDIMFDPGGEDMTIDAGLIKARLGDYVWLDRNRDGTQDEPETAGMNGVKVVLYKEKNDGSGTFESVDETTTSDLNGKPGYYSFEELDPGRYQVCFERPDGYAFTAAGVPGTNGAAGDSDAGLGTLPDGADTQVNCSDVIELEAGEENLTIDAGLLLGKIGDYVWYDRNRDGIRDEEEIGVNDVTVILYEIDGAGHDQEKARAVTKNKERDPEQPGYYLFDDLTAGTYKVCFEQPQAYGFTAPGQGSGTNAQAADSDAGLGTLPAGVGTQIACSDEFELEAGEVQLTIDAGLVKGRIGDYVWFDRNRDGMQDEEAEDGFNDVKVELFKKNEHDQFVQIDETVTADKDGDPQQPGYYLFDELDPGEYRVCFERPNRHVFSHPSRGDEEAADSNADRSSGCSDGIVLEAGGEDLTIDAGLMRRPSRGILIPPQDEDDPINEEEDPRDSDPVDQRDPKDNGDPDDPGDPTEFNHPGRESPEGDESGTPDADPEEREHEVEPGIEADDPPGRDGATGTGSEAGEQDAHAGAGTEDNNSNAGNVQPPAGQNNDSDTSDEGSKPSTLPLTGESMPIWPFIGIGLIAAAVGVWFASNKKGKQAG